MNMMSLRKRLIIGTVSVIVFSSVIGTIFLIPEIADFVVSKGGFSLPSFSFEPRKNIKCRIEPIFYSIGAVDRNFGISEELFREAVREAEEIWESVIKEDIFIPSEGGGVSVSLVFDERQAETSRIKDIFEGIETVEDRIEAARREYDLLTIAVAPMEVEIKDLNARYIFLEEDLFVTVSLYNSKKDEYEKQVSFWNEKGGAPKKIYEELVNDKSDIDILYRQIVTKEAEFKSLAETINKKVAAYNDLAGRVNTIAGIINRLASSLNENISDYNRLQADREEFVTGTYKVDGAERSIDVYQFYDYRELVIILAHEMGHALGMGHASLEESIMFPKITYQEARLSEEDIIMLEELCR